MPISEAIRLRKLEIRHAEAMARNDALVALAKSPLCQAALVWLVVEGAQRAFNFGSVSGSILEAGAMARMFDVEKVTGDISAIAKAAAPLVPAVIR